MTSINPTVPFVSVPHTGQLAGLVAQLVESSMNPSSATKVTQDHTFDLINLSPTLLPKLFFLATLFPTLSPTMFLADNFSLRTGTESPPQTRNNFGAEFLARWGS
jgi:hypothetical protein